jgi:hypothetical protein
MKRTAFATLALLAACAPASPGAPTVSPTPAQTTPEAATMAASLNPVGLFEFTTPGDEGEEVKGTIEVTGQPGTYGGRIRAGNDEIPITEVAVTGQRMVVNAETPGGTMTIILDFTGDTFIGGYTLRGDTGEMRGRRVP